MNGGERPEGGSSPTPGAALELRVRLWPDATLAQIVEVVERSVIEATLAAHPTRVAAAKALGFTREGLYRAERRLGIRTKG